MVKYFLAALLALAVVSAYPVITLQGSGYTYVAQGSAWPTSVTTYPNTYDYVDGYNQGYTSAWRDSVVFHNYNQPVRQARLPQSSWRTPYPTNPLHYTHGPGLSCNYGRSDLCMYEYERCPSGHCRFGNDNYARYTPQGYVWDGIPLYIDEGRVRYLY